MGGVGLGWGCTIAYKGGRGSDHEQKYAFCTGGGHHGKIAHGDKREGIAFSGHQVYRNYRTS